jgi:hypothetical protein
MKPSFKSLNFIAGILCMQIEEKSLTLYWKLYFEAIWKELVDIFLRIKG